MSRLPLAVTSLAAAAALSACATVMTQHPQPVEITSDPSGAEVTIDGEHYGFTPITAPLSTESSHEIVVRADGYPEQHREVERGIRYTYALGDIMLAVVPLVVDLYTGAIYRLRPGDLHFQFAPVPERRGGGGWSDNISIDINDGSTSNTSDATSDQDLYCCVNGAYYECPNLDAVAQCAPPELAGCMMGCDMTDFSCPDQCLVDYPVDPSSCNRAASRDGECQ